MNVHVVLFCYDFYFFHLQGLGTMGKLQGGTPSSLAFMSMTVIMMINKMVTVTMMMITMQRGAAIHGSSAVQIFQCVFYAIYFLQLLLLRRQIYFLVLNFQSNSLILV